MNFNFIFSKNYITYRPTNSLYWSKNYLNYFFVTVRNFFNDKKINAFGVDISLKDINEAKKNYKKIQKDMMKNKLPTNKEFIEEFVKAIDDFK